MHVCASVTVSWALCAGVQYLGADPRLSAAGLDNLPFLSVDMGSAGA